MRGSHEPLIFRYDHFIDCTGILCYSSYERGGTMSVKIYNFSLIKDLPKVFEADVSNVSLAEIIDYLETEYNSEIRKVLLVGDKVGDRARVLINGQSVTGMDAQIPDGSKLVFSLILPGG